MVDYAVAILIVVAFVYLIDYFGLVEKSTNVVSISKNAFGVISSSTLTDDDKEVVMRKHAKTLGRLFMVITLGVSFAVLFPMSIAWGLDFVGLLSFEAVISTLLSWPLIIGGTALMVVVIWLR